MRKYRGFIIIQKLMSLAVFLIFLSFFQFLVAQKEATYTQEGMIKIQQALKDADYDPGVIDGMMGEKTREALKEFQKQNSLEPTGNLSEETLLLLLNPKKEEPETTIPITLMDKILAQSVLVFASAAGLLVLIILLIIRKKRVNYKKVLKKAEKAYEKENLDKAQMYYEKVIKAFK